MDPIFEAYNKSTNINESSEKDIVKRLITRLKAYKKKPGHVTLSDVEDTISASGEGEWNFNDEIQNTLEYLGDRFFGPPPVYDTRIDSGLDKAIKNLEKNNK